MTSAIGVGDVGRAASRPGTDWAAITTVTTALAIGSATLDAAAARSNAGGGTLGADTGNVLFGSAAFHSEPSFDVDATSSDVDATTVESSVVVSESFVTSSLASLT